MSCRDGIFKLEITLHMIGKLQFKRLLLLPVLLFASGYWGDNLSAQTTVLQSGYSSPTFTYGRLGTGEASNFVSFDIQNDNCCPVRLTRVGMYHAGLQPFSDGTNNWNVSHNEESYQLYYSSSNTTGGPAPLTAGNGWTLAATSNPINTGAVNQIVDTMFHDLNIVIPAQSKMRFVVSSNDTIVWTFDQLPLSTTSNGITFIHGSGSEIWVGWGAPNNVNANAGGFVTPFNSLNFHGNVSLEQLAPNPPIATATPGTVCVGDSAVIRASIPGTVCGTPGFTLRHPKGNIIATNNTGKFTVTNLTAADAGSYTVTVNQCSQESSETIVRINVSDPPAPTVDGKFEYCLNERFEPIIVNGTNPRWYYTPTGGSPIPVTPTINTSFPNVLFYYVSQTDQFGCESSERTLVRLSAAPKPDKPIVTTPQYYCENSPADQLTAAGDTLTWYYMEQGGVPSAIAPTPNTTKSDSFQYYVTQTIDGCESDRAKIDVVITFRPNGLILVDKEELCQSDSLVVSYYGSAFPTAAYNWRLPDGSVVLNPDSAFDQGPLRLQVTEPGKQTVGLVVGASNCFSDVYTQDIYVKPLPTGRIITKDNVCLGQPELVSMEFYTKTTDTFDWDFDGGLTNHFTTDQGPYGVYWNTPGKKIITVDLYDEGCKGVVKDSVIVRPKPDASFTAEYFNHIPDKPELAERGLFPGFVTYNEGDSLCISDSLKLTANTIEPGSRYTWSPSGLFDANNSLPATYARVDTRGDIILEVVDEFGCENVDTLIITTKSCCEMAIPNAFSPNADGINDYFQPVTTGNREIKTFQVYNRYGQIVYENKGFRNGWDGTLNGNKQNVGTYFYLISFICEGELVHQKGEVILLR